MWRIADVLLIWMHSCVCRENKSMTTIDYDVMCFFDRFKLHMTNIIFLATFNDRPRRFRDLYLFFVSFCLSDFKWLYWILIVFTLICRNYNSLDIFLSCLNFVIFDFDRFLTLCKINVLVRQFLNHYIVLNQRRAAIC